MTITKHVSMWILREYKKKISKPTRNKTKKNLLMRLQKLKIIQIEIDTPEWCNSEKANKSIKKIRI